MEFGYYIGAVLISALLPTMTPKEDCDSKEALCLFFFPYYFSFSRPSSLLIACTAAPLSIFFPITAANKSQQFEFVSADLFVSDVKLSPELQLSVPFGPN